METNPYPVNSDLLQPKPSASAPILIAGHSHMCALVGDCYLNEPELHPVTNYSNVLALHGPWPRDDAYWRVLREKADGNSLALVWGGNEHNLFYFFEDQPFDFISRHVGKIISALNIVPQRMVKEKYHQNSIKMLQDLLHDLANARMRVSVIGTPPPKKDNEKLREMFAWESHFQDVAKSLKTTPESMRIRPPHVRLKLWFLLQDMLADAARNVGAKFISVPSEVQDEDGFLRSEYWHCDVTHANHLYGEIMLKRVLAELKEA